jgi:hypothetical protein
MERTAPGRRLLAYFDRVAELPQAEQDEALDYATDLLDRITDDRGYTAEEQAILDARA